MRLALLLLGATMLAPCCGAQGDDAYPTSTVASEPDQASTVLDPSRPPPAISAPTRKGHWWGRMVPTDRSLWLLSYIADATQFSYQEVDTLETAHIKSGKGMREARLAVKMLAGAGALGSLAVEVQKSKHAKRRKSGTAGPNIRTN